MDFVFMLMACMAANGFTIWFVARCVTVNWQIAEDDLKRIISEAVTDKE